MHKRQFIMPNGESSCCGARINRGDLIYGEDTCKHCGCMVYPISDHPKYANSFMDLKGIFVNDNKYGKRVRQVRYTSKYFIAPHGKIVRLEFLHSFTYNWATGRMYRVHIQKPNRKMVRDITYVVGAYDLQKEFIKKVIQWRAFYLFPEIDIIRDIEKSLGVDDIFAHVDKMYGKREMNDLLKYILYCLAYPKYTWMRCPLHLAPSPRFRKALKEGKNQKALYSAYFNNNVGKSTIEFLNNDLVGVGKDAWWAVRFLSLFLNKGKIWNLIKSRWIVNMLEDFDKDMDEYFNDAPLEQDLTKKNLSRFTDEYGTQRFLNQIADCSQSAQGIRMYIRDSISMWAKIKKQIPDYRIPKSNSLRDMHDNLLRDSRKLSVENEEIKYTRDEKELNSVYGDIEFVLPDDVHTIINHGDALHICVGGAGYTREAVNKNMVILFGLQNGNPVVCMQIQKHRLVQAKMQGNDLAKNYPNVRSAITDMCEENGIVYDDCYDLVSKVGPIGLYQREMALPEREMVLPGPAVEAEVFEEPNNWLF